MTGENSDRQADTENDWSYEIDMNKIGWIFSWAILLVFGVVLNGYVVMILWGWFIVPSLGMPEITITTAAGLSLFAGYVTTGFTDSRRNDDRSMSDVFVRTLIECVSRAVFVLMIGRIILLFM